MNREGTYQVASFEFASRDRDAIQTRSRKRSWRARVALTLLGVFTVVVLPFVVLIRVSVYLYAMRDIPTWLALGGGALATTVLLTLCAAWVSQKLSGRGRVRWLATRMVLPLVLGYCLYSLLYLSSVNAKSPEVRAYYRSLHPILRVAVSTMILVDRDMVVTDVHRDPQDYQAMGLPVNEASLHYEQSDGYVHAVDLRTLGRGLVRNWAVAVYFRAMGFQTLRHRGSEDHLHVSLPLH